MANIGGGGDPWRITIEERKKHDNQFMSLNPIGNMITGEQARGFFLQSGLPPQVLGQIWSLADMNSDGKMDQKEFSIAMHLIKNKLKGVDVPQSLPSSLKADPTQMVGGFGAQSVGMTMPAFAGTMPANFGRPSSTPPNLQAQQMAGFQGMSTMPPGMTTISAKTAPSVEWAVPQHSKLKYTQMFNFHDKSKKGYLSGMEARTILTQSNLTHALLAQIWSLSDIDNDGKLSTEEFVLSMHLVDVARSNQPLPQRLPPELIPPSYRRTRSGSGSAPGGPPVGTIAVSQPQMMPLVGGGTLGPSAMVIPPNVMPGLDQVTFEDKRKANFDKGQAELEKRRLALEEQRKQEEEARLAAERAEQEKRERIRQEQERKKQMELEKHLQKQRELEHEREEHRRKALEQREAARREMERQRQLEWERQRKEQLIAERQREQNQVEQLQSETSKLKLDLEALNNKKTDFSLRIMDGKSGITDITHTIDSMRYSRDTKMADIDRYQEQILEWTQTLQSLQQEGQRLNASFQLQNSTISDTHKTVLHSHKNKQLTIEKLKKELDTVEKDTAAKLQEIDSHQNLTAELGNKITEMQAESVQLQMQLQKKQDEWNKKKRENEEGEETKKRDEREKQERLRKDLEQQRLREESEVKQKGTLDGLNWSLGNSTQSPSTTDMWVSSTTQSSQSQSADIWSSAFAELTSASATTSQESSLWGSSQSTSQPNAFQSPPPTTTTTTTASTSDTAAPKPYRAMYQFDARNPDEITLIPGDRIMVLEDQTGAEPGWMKGEKDGQTGWFPQAYVEPIAEEATPPPASQTASSSLTNNVDFSSHFPSDFNQDKHLPSEPASVSGGVSGDSHSNSNLLTASESSSFTAVTASGPSPTPGQGLSAPEGLQAQALYPWRAKKDNHLTFNKGDVICVKEQQDMWWSGELSGKIGWFPKSYVKLIGAPANTPQSVESSFPASAPAELPASETTAAVVSDHQEYYVAMYTYTSSEPGDLSFNQGDIITVTKSESDWWTGALGDKSGIFPANYVKKMETQPGQKIVKKPEIASVIAPYTATGPEQLSLVPGQLIQVRKKSPSGWWEGELQARGQKRRIGWFPANYVKMLGTSARNTPVDGQTSLSPHFSPTPDGRETNGAATPTPMPMPTSAPALEQVIAMYPYTAQNEDELNFHKGSVINVISKDDQDWWKGELNGVTGMFPANYVQSLTAEAVSSTSSSWSDDPSVNAVTSPMEKKRQSCIHELIDTEESYLKDISIVAEVFQTPLTQEGVATEEELQSIFVNLPELILCSTKVVKAMRVRKKMIGSGQVIHMIGDILCENLPHLTPYIRFCSCQLNAANLIQSKTENNPEFKATAKKCCQDPRTKGMPLSSFLLKPMQRITKYPLLVSKILENTPPDHPDYQNLKDALARAEELCQQVNEGVREKENSDRLEWMQNHIQIDGLVEKITFNSITNCMGPRKFLHAGSLYKAKSGKELVGFLFNDFLLLTQPQRPLGSAFSNFSFDAKSNIQYRMYKSPLFLNEVLVKLPSETESTDNSVFHLSHIDRVYMLKSIGPTERGLWVKLIQSASKNYLETERKKRERAHSLKKAGAVGRLLVVIMEGVNLRGKGCTGKSDPYCEVSMGAQEHKTKVINANLNPKWNSSMQFTITNLHQDVLCLTVYDRDLFTPNDFLGRTEIRIYDIYREGTEKKGPITKRLVLHEVDTGEVVVKLDLQLYDNS